MPAYSTDIFIIFIDIVNKNVIIFTVNFVIHNRASDVVKVGPDLMEASCFRGSLDQTDFSVLGVGSGAEGFEFGQGRVGAGDHSLADIDPAGLVFAESIQRRIDDTGPRRPTVDDGKVSLLDFPALLHLA